MPEPEKKWVGFAALKKAQKDAETNATTSLSAPIPPTPPSSVSAASVPIVANVVNAVSTARSRSSPSIGRAPRAGSSPSAASAVSAIAPARDYTKVANSIGRKAADGVFKGKSKQLYDFLYKATRGAVKPSFTVRASKATVMRGCGINSSRTFYNNVTHLESLGLVRTTRIDGEQEGNLYEVLLPEEVGDDLVQLVQSEHLAQSGAQLPQPPGAETTLGGIGASVTLPMSYEESKTSFKTFKNDDDKDAVARFFHKLDKAFRDESGEGIEARINVSGLDKLGDVLVMQLRAAAANTAEPVNSAAGLLAKHVEKRFAARERVTTQTSPKLSYTPNMVGKQDYVSDPAQPMTETEREEKVDMWRHYLTAENGFFHDEEKWMLTEEWSQCLSLMSKSEIKLSKQRHDKFYKSMGTIGGKGGDA